MWELDYKESWELNNWCFWTIVLEKTLESSLDCKDIQLVHPKRDQSCVFIGRIDAEAETPNTLATWYKELTHLKRPWCWERLKAGGEEDNRGWDGWMASLTQWTWVWVNRELVMDREAWHSVVHGVAKSWTWLSDWTELKPSSLSWWLRNSLWELAFCVIMFLFPPSTPRVAFAPSQGRAGPVLASTLSLCRFIQEIFSHDTSICWKICVINKSKVCTLWLAPPGRQDPRWVVGLLSTCEADVRLVLAWWWVRQGSGITRELTEA